MSTIRIKIQTWLSVLSERARVIWLAVIAFTESSFFPVPPDPFLMLAIFSKPKKWLKYVSLVTTFSILGGILGYLIGMFFFDFVGEVLINTYSLHEEFDTVQDLFLNNAFWSIFVSAFTPFPYKIFTISAGLFGVNIFTFVIASVLGRGLRFSVVGSVSYLFGKKIAKTLKIHFF